MTGEEAVRKYNSTRRKLREKAALLTPKVLTNYPFEVLVVVIALCMGLPFLMGAAAPASLVSLVGNLAFLAWSFALTLGGITVAVGLRVGDRPNPLVVATGLQLLGGCFGVYALAVIAAMGLAGWTGLVAYGFLFLLSLVRATHFRRIVDIQRGARRLPGGDRRAG